MVTDSRLGGPSQRRTGANLHDATLRDAARSARAWQTISEDRAEELSSTASRAASAAAETMSAWLKPVVRRSTRFPIQPRGVEALDVVCQDPPRLVGRGLGIDERGVEPSEDRRSRSDLRFVAAMDDASRVVLLKEHEEGVQHSPGLADVVLRCRRGGGGRGVDLVER